MKKFLVLICALAAFTANAQQNIEEYNSAAEAALKIFEKIHPENHPELITTKQNIAAVKTAITNKNSNDEL